MVLDMRLALIRLSTLAFEASASADSANPAYSALGFTPFLSGVTGYRIDYLRLL